MRQYNLEFIRKYKFEMVFITTIIALSCIVVEISKKMNGDQNLSNYFWIPSSIMQSVTAIYALFIAFFVLSIQNNQKSISLIGDLLKPPFKVVSYVIAITIYFNGLVVH